MSLQGQVIVILLGFLLFFVYIRGLIYEAKRSLLNNSAYKKKKKGETFKEWLFYSRYKNIFPKYLFVLYYAVWIFHLFGLFTCVFLSFLGESEKGGLLAADFWTLDVIFMVILAVIFRVMRGANGKGEIFKKKRPKNKK